MMVALEGQHSGKETNAFSNRMPLSSKRERVLGKYLRSSLRMSSVMMKTKLGLAGFLWAAVEGLSGMAEKNRMTNAVEANAAEANSRTVFLLLLRQRPHTVLLRHGLLLLKFPKGGALSSPRLSKGHCSRHGGRLLGRIAGGRGEK